ncbi:MAG: M15 family metallopeptidase, partial [Bacteriovorax sp.]|nr:M15 family metallopeptidase [Bacteriovorax sp.]
MIDLAYLSGKTTDQLVSFQESKHLVHREMNQSLVNLFNAAKNDGFDLAITSTFRSYETQKIIWNEKSLGLRAVLDSNSIPVDLSTKSSEEILFLILRWSAIPGGSRHHWGTDLDVYDKKAVSADYKVQLVPSEYESQGPFYQSTKWLNENMERFGFFRPYSRDCGGIAPEPWHLSYRPVSENLLAEYTYDRFVEHLNISDFRLLEEALKN